MIVFPRFHFQFSLSGFCGIVLFDIGGVVLRGGIAVNRGCVITSPHIGEADVTVLMFV